MDHCDNPAILHNQFSIVNNHTVFHNPNSNTFKKALIISCAEKAIGQNKYWLNEKTIDIKEYLEKEILVNTNIESNETEILEAKIWVIENLKDHTVYKETENEEQKTLSVWGVINNKK